MSKIDNKKKRKKRKKKNSFFKRFLFLILIIILILVGYLTYGTFRNGGGARGILSTILGQNNEEINNLEPISFLILGSSQNLTDTIMVAKYNPKTQKAYLLSIPRDTYTGSSKNTATASEKLNALYKGKYPEKTLSAVNKITGLDLKYYLIVDTEALKALVDAIGGVYFDVPIDMKYTDKKQDLYINLKKGYQLLDGNKAEQVVRFRHNQNGTTYSAEYGNNDIGRMKTQRNFLKAVVEQTLTIGNITKAKKILDIAQKYVETNMSFDLLKQYIPVAVEFKIGNLETSTLPGSPEKCNGTWLFIHDKFKVNSYLTELNQKLIGEEETEVEENLSNIKIELLNGTGKSANLTKFTKLLKDSGYTVSKVGNTNETSKTAIINKSNISDTTLSNLKELLGAGNISTSNKESSVSVTIILGKDIKK